MRMLKRKMREQSKEIRQMSEEGWVQVLKVWKENYREVASKSTTLLLAWPKKAECRRGRDKGSEMRKLGVGSIIL